MLFGSCSVPQHPINQGEVQPGAVHHRRQPPPPDTPAARSCPNPRHRPVSWSLEPGQPPQSLCHSPPSPSQHRGHAPGARGGTPDLRVGCERPAGGQRHPRRVEEQRGTRRFLCHCKLSTNQKADRDVFLDAAAQLSLLVSLRRRKRLLVYLQMLEVIL